MARNPKLLTRASPSTGRLLAYAKFNGRTVSFGPAGPDAREAFDRALARWLANGRRLLDRDEQQTVENVLSAFLEQAARGYSAGEVENLQRALAPVRQHFGQLPAAEFTVSCLEVVQHELADQALTRSTIRSRVNAIRRAWRWAEQRRLVPIGSWKHLCTLEHLKPGRTKAREPKIVEAVPWAWVEPVLEHLLPPLRAAVQLQWWSGLRPGEVLSLTGRQIQRTGKVWTYRPVQHKGVWRGRERVVRFGPRAQEVIGPLLKLDPDAAVISPRDGVAAQKVRKRAARRSPMTPSQRARDARNATRRPLAGEFYDVRTYNRAVQRACDAAEVPRWSPHRLRHACAARLFEQGQFEAARAVLGHARLDMTRHYAASADSRLAEDAMQQHG